MENGNFKLFSMFKQSTCQILYTQNSNPDQDRLGSVIHYLYHQYPSAIGAGAGAEFTLDDYSRSHLESPSNLTPLTTCLWTVVTGDIQTHADRTQRKALAR